MLIKPLVQRVDFQSVDAETRLNMTPNGVTAMTHGRVNPVLVSVVATVAEEAAPAAAPAETKAPAKK